MNKRSFLVAVISIFLPGAATAAVIPESPMAYQPNSSALTGPIILSRERIVFSTGASSPLEAVEAEGIEGEVYRLLEPLSELHDGKTICQGSSIGYIVAEAQQGTAQEPVLRLAIHGSGDLSQDASPCAVYEYTGPEIWTPTLSPAGAEEGAQASGENASAEEPAVTPPPAGSSDEEPGKWKVITDTNPIDDSKTVVLVLEADTGRSQWNDPVDFIARCQSDKTEVYVNWRDYLGDDSRSIYDEWKNVIIRIGDEPARTERWGLSTDKQATFAPAWAGELLKEMLGSDKLVLQTTPFNQSPVTAMFDTTGLGVALKELAETCGWSY